MLKINKFGPNSSIDDKTDRKIYQYSMELNHARRLLKTYIKMFEM